MIRTAVLLVVLAGSVVGFASGNDWGYAAPEDHGIDAARLERMRDVIDALDLPIDSVVVVRHGEIVFEDYPDPRIYSERLLHNLYSVTKSVTSILIGIAIGEGTIGSVDERVVDFFGDREIAHLDERKRRMTVEDLLTMRSGLSWIGPDDMHHSWGDGLRSGDPVQYALDRPMVHEPGSVWYYNGGCSHLLSAILTEATGMSTLAFANESLFGPLGIDRVRWPQDPNGIYFGGQDIWLTPHGMAKLGQLYLNDGVWNGEQIVPADWIADSTRSSASTWSGEGYGYQWWLFPESGIFHAAGAFEQRIYGIPDLDMVVVMTARNWPKGIDPSERAEGPATVEWLLGSFILPACKDYTEVPFADFGFELEIPRLTSPWIEGWAGSARASESAGLITFRYAGSPYERVGVQWTTDGRRPAQTALASFVEGLREEGVGLETAGPPIEAEIGRRKVLQQSVDVTTEDAVLSVRLAVLPCDGTGRTFVFFHSVAAEIAAWVDPDGALGRLIEGFTCSD